MKKLRSLWVIAVLAIFITSSEAFAQDGIWKTYTRANSGLIGDSIMSFDFGPNDSIWVGAWQGVAEQTQTGWKFYNTKTYMPSNEIWDVDYANATLWFAHHSGITGFDGTTWTSYDVTNSGLVNAPCQHLAHDNTGDLWIATARGLGRYSQDKVWSSYKKATVPAMPYDGIEALATDMYSNDLWMSFIGTAGLVKFSGGNSAEAKYYKQDSIPGFPKGAVYIKCLAVQSSGTHNPGNLWAGTQKFGVVRINESGATVFSRANTPAIKNDTIHTVAVDACGNVWIGTDAGAVMYDGTDWFGFSVATGHLPNDYVYYIKPDRLGHVWIGTKGGVTEFRPRPRAIDLISPLMNMTMNDSSVLCKWEWACPNIEKYMFEIATNEQFAFSTIDSTSESLTQTASKLATGLTNNTTYYWRVRAKNDAGWGPFSDTWVFHVSYPNAVEASGTGTQFALMQNYPNPCSDQTMIKFSLPRFDEVTLTIYDVLGCERAVVLSGQHLGPGEFTMPFDAALLPASGMYIYRLEAGADVTQRMMQVVR